ncbi:hypothetical protein GCM10023185_13480 [Hymenobacter saemangeumensis]|uniref:Uncharacterized protein n=1 Tax=Hymenobacter saemangeumensis TaxID=1084522 RepID=A0ABP8I8A3_9BACT
MAAKRWAQAGASGRPSNKLSMIVLNPVLIVSIGTRNSFNYYQANHLPFRSQEAVNFRLTQIPAKSRAFVASCCNTRS